MTNYNNISKITTANTIISSTPWHASVDVNLSKNNEFRKLLARIAGIEKRLSIIIPNEELQKRYPALQEAYDNYKLIEKLVSDGE